MADKEERGPSLLPVVARQEIKSTQIKCLMHNSNGNTQLNPFLQLMRCSVDDANKDRTKHNKQRREEKKRVLSSLSSLYNNQQDIHLNIRIIPFLTVFYNNCTTTHYRVQLALQLQFNWHILIVHS